MINKHVYTNAKYNKYNVNRELESFTESLANTNTLDLLKVAREHFLQEIDEFLPMFDIHNVKTSIQWQAFMKVCEKLMSFDNMIDQCFTSNDYDEYRQILDEKAKFLIKELGEN